MSGGGDRGGVEPGRELVRRRLERAGLGEWAQATAGLARIAAGVGWRGAAGLASAYVNGASRVLRAAQRGESAAQILQEAESELRTYARELLEIGAEERPRHGVVELAPDSASALRRRGEELLRLSADIEVEVDSHPAYMRILEALAPDEARILRFLAQGGPQPSVDVRAGLPLASELVEQGRTMIGEEAGCRHRDRVYAYLNNLHRLGLIWFSREPLRDAARYQVLEAQPEVVAALGRGRMARTVRRSIVLTPFGDDFCGICLPP
ncbi:MAG: Abi-alpha family protein [Solirubrobacterales bacterium]